MAGEPRGGRSARAAGCIARRVRSPAVARLCAGGLCGRVGPAGDRRRRRGPSCRQRVRRDGDLGFGRVRGGRGDGPHRGHWWSPDGRRLLAARVDTSPLPSWWIADPASPDAEPVEVRYPAAGAANAEVGLALFDVDGDARVDVAWDQGGWSIWPGCAGTTTGCCSPFRAATSALSACCRADPDTGACRLCAASPTTPGWSSCRACRGWQDPGWSPSRTGVPLAGCAWTARPSPPATCRSGPCTTQTTLGQSSPPRSIRPKHAAMNE